MNRCRCWAPAKYGHEADCEPTREARKLREATDRLLRDIALPVAEQVHADLTRKAPR